MHLYVGYIAIPQTRASAEFSHPLGMSYYSSLIEAVLVGLRANRLLHKL